MKTRRKPLKPVSPRPAFRSDKKRVRLPDGQHWRLVKDCGAYLWIERRSAGQWIHSSLVT